MRRTRTANPCPDLWTSRGGERQVRQLAHAHDTKHPRSTAPALERRTLAVKEKLDAPLALTLASRSGCTGLHRMQLTSPVCPRHSVPLRTSARVSWESQQED